MNNPRNERLEARVKAANACNAYANELYTKLQAFFEPFVGKPILMSSGLLARVKHRMSEQLPLPNTHRLSVQRYHSEYSLCYTVKTSEQDGEHTCCYHDTTVYIGRLNGYILTEIIEPETRRTDYTAVEVAQLRENLKAAARALDNARSALYPFPEDDR